MPQLQSFLVPSSASSGADSGRHCGPLTAVRGAKR
eukprot:SAG25_NODE_9960_length_350_cov_1.645418_1_plen_34_part_10